MRMSVQEMLANKQEQLNGIHLSITYSGNSVLNGKAEFARESFTQANLEVDETGKLQEEYDSLSISVENWWWD